MTSIKITTAQVDTAIKDQTVTADRTAFKSTRHVVHALPDAPSSLNAHASYTAVCGRSMTGEFIGTAPEPPQAVTCRSCVRALLAAPQIRFEITAVRKTGYERSENGETADHSRCPHTSEGRDPFNHDEGCPSHPASECGCYYGCKCECDCSLSDENCDAVGGRWMDGLEKTISERTFVLDYDEWEWDSIVNDPNSGPVTFWEAVGEYVEYTLRHGSYEVRFDLLDWNRESPGDSTMVATTDHDSEVFADYTLTVTGPGVGTRVRNLVFASL